EAVAFELAIGCVTGENEGIHRALPLQLWSVARMLKWVKISEGFWYRRPLWSQNGHKTVTKTIPIFSPNR
ncbi:MAG TPA: hypothetical protein VGJ21_07510, partial [Terracidiphilus sp.]